MSQAEKAFKLVFKHFNKDIKKTQKWFTTKNPLLGNIRPMNMVALDGKCPKLLKFIKNSIEENKL